MSSTPNKKPRKSNYSASEIEILTEEVGKHNGVLSASFSSTITHKLKNGIWNRIADRINATSAANRSGDDLRKKWNELKCQTRKKAMSHKREQVRTGGGPAPPPMSQVEEKVISLIPKCQVEGIAGGLETGGFENEVPVIQILEVPQIIQSGTDFEEDWYLSEAGQSTTAEKTSCRQSSWSSKCYSASASASQAPVTPCHQPSVESQKKSLGSSTLSVNDQKLPTASKSEKASRQKTSSGDEIIRIEKEKLLAMKQFFNSVSSKLDGLMEIQQRKLQLEEEKMKILRSTENYSKKTPSPRNIFKLLEL